MVRVDLRSCHDTILYSGHPHYEIWRQNEGSSGETKLGHRIVTLMYIILGRDYNKDVLESPTTLFMMGHIVNRLILCLAII